MGHTLAAWVITATWVNASTLLKLEGGRGLIPMALPVRQVSEFLMQNLPNPARGAVFIFEGVFASHRLAMMLALAFGTGDEHD